MLRKLRSIELILPCLLRWESKLRVYPYSPASLSVVKSSPMNTTRPDYEIAHEELNEFFKTLGLTVEISGAHAAVEETPDEKGWAHVAMTVNFHRAERRTNNSAEYRPAFSASFPYKMGTGLVRWSEIAKFVAMKSGKGSNDYRDAEQMARHGPLSPKAQAAICARFLPSFVKKVNPAEVLAACAREGEDARGQTFEEWAGNYGYDTDSRRAEATYRACQELGDKVRKLLSHVPGAVEKLAELSGRL